jgi:hypothetical protein
MPVAVNHSPLDGKGTRFQRIHPYRDAFSISPNQRWTNRMILPACIQHLELYEYDIQRICKLDGYLRGRLLDSYTGRRRFRRRHSRPAAQKANAENQEEEPTVKLASHLPFHSSTRLTQVPVRRIGRPCHCVHRLTGSKVVDIQDHYMFGATAPNASRPLQCRGFVNS